MKKFALLTVLSSFLAASAILAQTPEPFLKVDPPTRQEGGKTVPIGYSDLGAFIGNILTVAFGVAILVVLVMLIWGAFEWITSGGDKEAVGKARGRIVNALIGLAVLAVAFALATVASKFLGFDITKIPIPTPK